MQNQAGAGILTASSLLTAHAPTRSNHQALLLRIKPPSPLPEMSVVGHSDFSLCCGKYLLRRSLREEGYARLTVQEVHSTLAEGSASAGLS